VADHRTPSTCSSRRGRGPRTVSLVAVVLTSHPSSVPLHAATTMGFGFRWRPGVISTGSDAPCRWNRVGPRTRPVDAERFLPSLDPAGEELATVPAAMVPETLALVGGVAKKSPENRPESLTSFRATN